MYGQMEQTVSLYDCVKETPKHASKRTVFFIDVLLAFKSKEKTLLWVSGYVHVPASCLSV